MTSFEYSCIKVDSYQNNEKTEMQVLSKMLNEYGEKGWELITIHKDGIAIFKRKKVDVY